MSVGYNYISLEYLLLARVTEYDLHCDYADKVLDENSLRYKWDLRWLDNEFEDYDTRIKRFYCIPTGRVFRFTISKPHNIVINIEECDL